MVKRAVAAIAIAGLAGPAIAGCGSQPATVAGPTPPAVTTPLASSLVSAQGTWAIADVGGSSSPEDNFWQLFVRPAGASKWSLVTPPAVADNGGLVAAANPASLLIGFRPSQGLVFSPLATSTDTGKNWAPGVLSAGLANVPDALSIGPSGQELALLENGTVDASTAGGPWTELTSVKALDASAAGRSCGVAGMNAVSFGLNGLKVVAGSCARRGVAGVFSDANGTWQAAGPTLPGAYLGDQVQVLRLSGMALLLAGTTLFAAWSDGQRWTVSAPLTGAGQPRASGFGPGGSAWGLLGGGRAAVISKAGAGWQALPAVPGGTAVLAAGTTRSEYDALAVSGSVLTVWRLTAGSWAKVQVMKVPIVPGSSG
jgi:hypothetical protein